MNFNNLPPDEDIKTFYTLFCEVFTAFHNYAVAKNLFQNKIFSWALTSFYYSLVHCGRAICFMSLNCFPKKHGDLHKLLSGEEIRRQKLWWTLQTPEGINKTHNFSELINGLSGITNNPDESRIRELGQYLEKIKKVREFNSYEMFIVAHQINHEILSPKLENGTKRIGNIVRKYLTFVTDLLFNYVQTKSDYFKAFLLDKNQDNKWAFKYLFASLKKQEIYSIREIEGIIKERLLKKISVQTDCPNEFYEKISFMLFHEKSRIIRNFIWSIEEIRESETNQTTIS